MIRLSTREGHRQEADRREAASCALTGAILFLALAALPALPVHGQTSGACKDPADQDFRLVPLVSGSELIQMALDREGRIFYASKGGEIRLYNPATRENRLLASLPVATAGYMGLLSLALDPEFPESPWIYLLYNPKNEIAFPDFRVARFTFDGQKLDPASERRILDIPNKDNHQAPEGTHTGGKLAFGPDGLLFITSGDNSQYGDFSPLDDRTPEGTALLTSGNTNHLGGKILRIRLKDDATYEIPSGNLFAPGLARTRPEIYAMGLRNPYSIHVDPRTGWVLVGDVGSDGPAASSPRGPGGGDEFLVVKKPGNFGWPLFAGPNLPYARYDAETRTVGALFDPVRPVNESRWNTGLKDLPPAQPSLFNFFKYNPDTLAARMGFRERSMVCIAGPRFRYRAGSPPTAMPPQMHGKWIIADHAMNRVGLLELEPSGDRVRTGRPLFANQTFRTILDMKTGPDGVLHVLEMYGRISRLEYIGIPATPAQCGLPLGCTQAGYVQYDPKAEVDDGSCRTPLFSRSGPLPPGDGRMPEGIRVGPADISIDGDGDHKVDMIRMDGRGGIRLRGKGPARYRFSEHVQRGLYLLRAETRDGAARRKVAVW